MGIPMMGALIGRFSDVVDLKKHGKLVLDGSNALSWLLKRYIHSNDFGGNMVELDKMFRQFLNSFLSQGIQLIVVYPGATPSEQRHGSLASKALHSEFSSRMAMFLLQRDRFNWFVQQKLAQVVLMRVVNELELEHHPVQSAYETYPTLAQLANKHDCPVLTSHADFILMSDVRNGFIKLDEMVLEGATTTRRYLKSNLLTYYSLQLQAAALPALLTLMRPDFAGRYWSVLNKLLNINDPSYLFERHDTIFRVGGHSYRAPRGQLDHVLRHFPPNLRTMHQVRQALAAIAPRTCLQEYDAINKTFTEPLSITEPEENLVPTEMNQLFNINEILTRRETIAEFLVSILMGQKQINRGNLEDKNLYWSTFSVADTARLFVMGRGNVGNLHLLDRNYATLNLRELALDHADLGRLNTAPDQMLYEMVFHFPTVVSSRIHMSQWLDSDRGATLLLRKLKPSPSLKCDEFVVILMLIRFVFKELLKPRTEVAKLKRDPNQRAQSPSKEKSPGTKPGSPIQVVDNSRGSELSATKSVASGGKSGSLKSLNSQQLDPERYWALRDIFARAVYNCFLYYTFKGCHLVKVDERLNNRTKDTTGQVYKIKLAIDEIDSDKVQKPNPSKNDLDHIKMKTLIDGLSVAMDKYCQLNSMYNYCGVYLEFNKWYDGQLIYKLMRYLRRSMSSSPTTNRQQQTSLLSLENPLTDLLDHQG